MKIILPHLPCSKTLFRLFGPALLLAALGAQAASVGPAGYTNNFSVQPNATDFATANIGGGSGDVTGATTLDAAVAALTAAGINTQLPLVAGAPPAAGASGFFNDTDKNLQTRPTGVKMHVILATLTNNAGGNASSVSVIFDLLQSTIVGEEVSGVRVYYSLTGLASSWSNVAGLNAAAAGLFSANVTLAAPWNVGSPLYLLFADDNGSGSPDTANQIDNFSAAVSGFTAELPVGITAQPQNRTVTENQSAAFSVGITGHPPITYQWYRGAGPIANATNARYTLAVALLPDHGALFSVVAANVASNVSYSMTSMVALLTVLTDTNRPVMVQVLPATNTTVNVLNRLEVHFSEAVTGVNAADLLINGLPATNVLVLAPDVYDFYFTQPPNGGVTFAWAAGHGLTDFAGTPNPFAGGSWSCTLDTSSTSLSITEFLAANTLGLADEDGEFSDWIEIYNPTDFSINLDGWHLTDSPANLNKWRFPGVTLASRAYLYLFASNKDRTNLAARLHTNFKLEKSGGSLVLTRPDGSISSQFLDYPAQVDDVAYGTGGINPATIGFLTPTAGAVNGAVFPIGLNDVTYSVARGYHSVAQTLTLTPAIAGSVIKYTIDGTKPSAANGLTYTGPIAVTPETDSARRGTRRIRAVALHASAASTKTKTHTYLFVNGITSPAIDGIVSQRNSNNQPQTDAIQAHPTYGPLLDDALLSLPVIVINNPSGIPSPSESETSVELFAPGGTEPGFQIDCGIQAVGNHSLGSPKNNFRLYFRAEYGDGKLQYDLFTGHPYDPAGATDTFDRLNVRSCSHDTFFWLADPGNPPNAGVNVDALYLRNIVMDDLQFQMGKLSTHGRYVHCIVNGQYHGLYHIREYPDEHFFASYLPGGTPLYEWTNGANPGENGSLNWQAVWNAIKTYGTTAGASNYAEFKRRVNVTDLADFLVLNWWAGNDWDWNPNQNWYGGGPNLPDLGGWRFFSYDNDIIWSSPTANTVGRNVPDGLVNSLIATHAEFQQLIRDRAYRHMANDGVLTSNQVRATLEFRENQITLAVVAETARWQGGAVSPPWDRDGEWRTELNRMKNVFFPGRCATVFSQMVAQGWYPVNAPDFTNPRGGVVPAGHQPVITGAAAIYATVDGSDPRLEGGAISPSAFPFTAGSITINASKLVRLRSRNGSAQWSALNEAVFTVAGAVPVSSANLIVSEIHYHPSDIATAEFIELKNVGVTPLNLFHFTLSGGLDFDFPNLTLAAGQRVIVAADTNAFLARYGAGLLLAGQYTGLLDNAGDHLVLQGPLLEPILDFSYEDSWYPVTDGLGFSLVVVNEHAAPDAWGNKSNWRPSTARHGSPGTNDLAAPVFPAVLVNEVLANGALPQVDAIELYNRGTNPADLGGWFLSDSLSVPQKFIIPPGTVLPGGGFLVFYANTSFGAASASTANGTNAFGLGTSGDGAFLFSGDGTNLTGYAHGFSFGASPLNVTYGRFQISTGPDIFVLQLSNTLGGSNSGPFIGPIAGPIVINEFTYDPASPNTSFIELLNTSSNLTFDLSYWQINGLSYTFPPGSMIGPRAYLVLAADRTAFAGEYGATIPVFGTYSGTFATSGETITLLQPGPTQAQDVIVDRVQYENALPWSTNASGTGFGFQLIDPLQDNSRVGNWASSYYPGSYTPATNLPGMFVPGFTNYNLRFVSITGLIGNPSRLLLYLGEIGEAYIDDLYLANGSVAEAGTNYITNGDFETPLPGAPALTNFFTSVGSYHTNSTLSQTNAHSGTNSLRIVSTNNSSFALARILYKDIPGPTNTQVCTLSFWYRPTFNCTNLFTRFQSSTIGNSSIPAAILTPPFAPGSNLPPTFVPAITVPPTSIRTPGGANSNAAALAAFPPLWLNEVQAQNISGPLNLAGQPTAWFELYNAGPNVITLTNLFLSGNFTNLTNWAFPAGATIDPGEFKLIFADGLTGLSTLAELHTSFALPPGGGSLALSRLHNGQPQVIDYLNSGGLTAGRSFGSFTDGQSFNRQEFSTVTPRAPNLAGLNSAPVLATLPGTNVNAGALLTFTANATDADLPAQILTFSLAGQPPGASITTGGLFTWTPAQNQAPGTNAITVIVADSGTPSLTATQTFNVIIIPPPRNLTIARTNATEVVLTWQAFAGRSYRVEYVETVDALGTSWTPIGNPLTATGDTLSFTDPIAPNAQRFYRVRQLQP